MVFGRARGLQVAGGVQWVANSNVCRSLVVWAGLGCQVTCPSLTPVRNWPIFEPTRHRGQEKGATQDARPAPGPIRMPYQAPKRNWPRNHPNQPPPTPKECEIDPQKIFFVSKRGRAQTIRRCRGVHMDPRGWDVARAAHQRAPTPGYHVASPTTRNRALPRDRPQKHP